MKSVSAIVFLASLVAVNALTTCQLNCMATAQTEAACTDSYNSTSCLCDTTFSTKAKECIYSAGCSSDVSTFYSYVNTMCDSDSTFSYAAVHSSTAAVAVASASAAAVEIGGLSVCQSDCMSQAATSASCDNGNYNATSCMCDNDDFATAAKACLYSGGCSTDVSTFYTYRSDICGSSVGTFTYAAAHSSTAAVAAASASVANANSNSLTNAASGGIGAAVTIVVFAALAAGLYAAGLVRFGKRRNVLLDSASGHSATSSEFPIKGSQVQHA